MSKKYAILRLKTPKAEGGFWEAFRLGLVDLGSTGEEYFDESGYPFPDEVHAFVSDWLSLSGDFRLAASKLENANIGMFTNAPGEGYGEGKEGKNSGIEKSGK